MSISQLLNKKWKNVFFPLMLNEIKLVLFETFNSISLKHMDYCIHFNIINVYLLIFIDILYIHLVYMFNIHMKQKTLMKEIFQCFQLHF